MPNYEEYCEEIEKLRYSHWLTDMGEIKMDILVTQSSMPDLDEFIDEIKDMWDSHWLTNMGPKHKKFQRQLCEYLGVENIDLFTNGHMALELTLQAMNLQARSRRSLWFRSAPLLPGGSPASGCPSSRKASSAR